MSYGSLKAQSLLELAIFGSIIIMLLGVLVSYGLRYNYQQQAMQQAFRKSLAQAAKQPVVSVSSVLINDKHIPNPSDTFGVGAVYPFSGSAGAITRDFKLNETPDKESELPRVAIDIKGIKCPVSYFCPGGGCDPPCNYLTAGIRTENNVQSESEKRYDLIYGSVCFDPAKNCGAVQEGCVGEQATDNDTGAPAVDNDGNPVCGDGNEYLKIKIVDSCAGEIIDYSTAVKQCRMIVDKAICKAECERGNDSNNPTNCAAVCALPIQIPWYCKTDEECGLGQCDQGVTHIYNFENLNKLFSYSSLQTIGLQQNYSQLTTNKNSLRKEEKGASGITTTDTLDWNTETKRTIVLRPYDPDKYTQPVAWEVTSNVGQNKESSTTTDWQ